MDSALQYHSDGLVFYSGFTSQNTAAVHLYVAEYRSQTAEAAMTDASKTELNLDFIQAI